MLKNMESDVPQFNTIVDNFEGKTLNSPNDITLSKDGTMYFTDPPFAFFDATTFSFVETEMRKLNFNGVFKYDPNDMTTTLITKDIDVPNGIALSEDEKSLYVNKMGILDNSPAIKKINSLLLLLPCLFISNKTLAQGTIVDVAVGNENFSTLVTALKAADLVAALQSEGPFTVFAPTNSAFSKIDSKVLSSLLEPASKGALANILTYHVVSGQLNAADVVKALNDGGGKVVVKALNNQSLTVMQKDGKIWLMDSNGTYSEIVATDVMGSNGVIHVIDTVVMPE
jgi:uncharacterized surface protein with fasciclin (FAS1) repeats